MKTDEDYLQMCLEEANKSDCHKAHFGSIIARGRFILGKGYNHTFEDEHECMKPKDYQMGSNPGLCLAVHAEWDALINAYRIYPYNVIEGAVAYIAGKYPNDEIRYNDYFSCTVCARLLKRAGIREIIKYNGDKEIIHMTIDEAMESAYEELRVHGGGEKI